MLTTAVNSTLLIRTDPLEALARRACAVAGSITSQSVEAVGAAAEMNDLREEETRIAARVPGDSSQFGILYDRYYTKILNYLYRRTMNRDLAEDLTSRTFLQAFDALRREHRKVWVCPWFYRIATNVHVSHLRGLKAFRDRLVDMGRHWKSFTEKEHRPDHVVRSRQESARVRECLASLPDRYRTVLILRYDEELPHREISEVLGLTAVTVRKRIERALRMLEDRYRNDATAERGRA